MSVGLQRLREDAPAIRQGALDKGEDPSIVDRALAVDARRRELLAEGDQLKAERNTASKAMGEAIRAGGDPNGPETVSLRERSTTAGSRISAIDAELATVEATLEDLLLRIPNPADLDAPVGGEEANVTIRTWGEQLPRMQPISGEVGADAPADGPSWERRPHWEIGAALRIFELERGAKIAGSGFPVYRGPGSALQRALINWFLDVHTRENGFTEIWPPAVVNAASARGTGQIPDKEDQMYVVTRDDLYLVPTAEVPVTNLHRDEIFEASELPVRYAAYSPCFRREAGAAGKDTRGILRIHQFDKVEMVLFERPEASAEALEWMTARAEDLLQRLGLAYRVLLMATREMGFVQGRKYDIEVWAPGVERWLEVSSCSNFRDYQARRMAVRYRPEPGAKPELVHTLNGSGLALPRVVAAIIETYQNPDGSVTVPEVLRPAMGTATIGPAA
ncbi:MAG TPA: serine--tRNA ligase [Verrucomicrobiae bacterium]|nr:serine--tRNA ligase [Verrucomicrobiae bacterium]